MIDIQCKQKASVQALMSVLTQTPGASSGAPSWQKAMALTKESQMANSSSRSLPWNSATSRRSPNVIATFMFCGRQLRPEEKQ